MSYENKGSVAPKAIVTSEPDRSGNYICNGTSDETDINRAISELTSGRTWKERVLLKGDFTIDGIINMDSYTILELHGKVFLANNSNVRMVLGTELTNVEMLNGEYDGNKANQTGDLHGIQFSSLTDSYFENIYVHDVHGDTSAHGRGFALYGTSARVTVFNCESSYNNKNGFLIAEQSKYIDLINNRARGNGVEGIVLSGTSAGNHVSHCNLLGNYLENNLEQDGIDLYKFAYFNVVSNNIILQDVTDSLTCIGMGHETGEDSSYNIISGNHLHCNNECYRGIGIHGESVHNLIEGNHIYGPNKDGIKVYVAGTNHNALMGNYIYNAGEYGILIASGADYTFINGNKIYGTTLNGIRVDAASCDETVIINNHLKNITPATEISDAGTNTVIHDNFEDENGWVP